MVEQLFYASAIAGAGTYLTSVVGAARYDMRHIHAEKRYQRHPHAQVYRQRPLVTAIISTQNAAPSIESCLASLRRGSYRKVEVIVVDQASADSTAAIVRQFQHKYPKFNLRLVARRSDADTLGAIERNIKRYAKGDLMLLIDGKTLLERDALSQSVRMLNSEPNVHNVLFRQRVASQYNTLGVLQRYHELMYVRANKTWVPIRNASSEAAMPLMRRRNASGRTAYLHSAVVYQPTRSLATFMANIFQRAGAAQQAIGRSGTAAWQRILVTIWALAVAGASMLLPLFLAYFLYLALVMREPALFMFSLAIASLLMLLSLWDDNRLKVIDRIGYTLLLPITFILFFIVTVVHAIAGLTVLVRPRRLLSI